MSQGSSYETYEKTHSQYDRTRLAVGGEQLIALVEKHFGTSCRQLRILDAGCGTGSHLQALEAAGYTGLTGLDASSTGLTVAAGKLGTGVKLICADIRQMPFKERSFDVILFSFTLHHLPHQDQAQLESVTAEVLKMAVALLAPGGMLCIITCTPEQMSVDGCMWYYKYFPEAARRLSSRFLPATTISQALSQNGLQSVSVDPVEKTYWTESSLDANGPQDENWRSGDSLFALCRQDPVLFERQLQALKRDVESGVAAAHIEAVRARAESIKQAVIVAASNKK